ncbi:MAG: hypothetical protein JF887_09635 [Candidatus Dormibacteraeota bacterium]|uniref:DUF4367 domain-containing protein n=1 Tax=Candidatus Amunia macphersoniae TaxID=3127014 RepID=A0A934NJM0_9BACT|nr:hypothetical protein [Candidatus Dormibacteraeota bacterium]
MRHLSEGLLRRLHDDRFAASNDQRSHLAGCTKCETRLQQVAADAGRASALFVPGAAAAPAVEPALGRLRSQVAAGAAGARQVLATPRPVRRRRWAVAMVAVPLVSIGLVASASAAGWLSVFSPTTVAPVTLTASSLTGLPDLSGYGHMHVTNPDLRQVAGPQQAGAATGLTVLRPASLPADIPSQVHWEVVGAGSATFTLDAAAADAAAAKAGKAAPAIPSGLDGTSITVNAGPAEVAVYGAAVDLSKQSTLPTLVIAQSVRPTASTNGATLQQLEDFLLAQPGVSPQLAAEIRAIGQIGSTLPIPVINGVNTSRTITIDGVQGVVTGDSTGLDSAVIWEKNGVVYMVGGLLPQSEALSIAQSLR